MDTLVNMTERTTIEVAVGILSNQTGQLLVAKRPPHWLGGGFWEFPGGKIEPNEDSEAALKRELWEEIGVQVQSCSPLIRCTYHYPERTVILYAWEVHSFLGEAAGLEGQEIDWCDPAMLNQLNLLPANRAIMLAVQLPHLYLITPPCEDRPSFLESLNDTLNETGIKLVQLRSKEMSREAYVSLAQKVLALCRRRNVSLLLDHEDLSLIDILDADGVHLRSTHIEMLTTRPLASSKWVCASCHTVDDIEKAEAIGVDFLLISPVRASLSTLPPIGWGTFAKWVNRANLPVYALGGLSPTDLSLAKNLGAQGIAASHSLWKT